MIIILLILILILLCKTVETYKSVRDNYKISICIPCISRDIPTLPRLLDSIQNQTYQPYEVVIRISEISNKYRKQLQKEFDKKYNSLTIRLLSSLKKQTASQNRNVICENIKGDIISCIDADDSMHYERCEILNDLFKKYNSKAILHNFKKKYNENTYKLSKNPNIYLGSDLYDWCQNSIKKYNSNGALKPNNNIKIRNLHRGHISFKKEVFKNVKYNTDSKYNRGQDARFIIDLIMHYGKKNDTMLYVTLPLTQYIVNTSPPKKYQ